MRVKYKLLWGCVVVACATILLGCLAHKGHKVVNKQPSFLILGHRGACGHEPENTIKSFLKAIEFGVQAIELDVHRCKSGELIVIHDKSLGRTTNGVGLVEDHTLDQIKKFETAKHQELPTLAEVFDAVNRRVLINIELKGKNTAQRTAQLIELYVTKKGWSFDDFIVSSFDHHELGVFAKLCPQVRRGAILVGMPVDCAAFAVQAGAQFAILGSDFLRPEYIDDAHRRGLKVLAFTVNDLKEARALKKMGVDGLFSDYPDRIKAL